LKFFPLLDFQYMILAFAFGVIGAILAYVAWAGYPARARDEEEQTGEFEIDASHEVKRNPVPPLLILLYVGAAVWAVAYAIIIGIFGGPIG